MSPVADRLREIIRCGLASGEDHGAIAAALHVLGLDPSDCEVDHPLIDLYMALLICTGSNGQIWLGQMQRGLLAEAVEWMTRDTSAEVAYRLRREATADRLRRIAACGRVYPDEVEDIEVAIDSTEPCQDHPLVELYRNLAAAATTDGPYYVDRDTGTLLREAAGQLGGVH